MMKYSNEEKANGTILQAAFRIHHSRIQFGVQRRPEASSINSHAREAWNTGNEVSPGPKRPAVS